MRNVIRKGLAVSVSVLLLSAIAAGCFPEIDGETDRPSDAATDLRGNSENVILPENFDENQKIAIASAEPVTWDKERIVSEIAKERRIVDELSGENSGPDDIFYSYTFEDDSELVFSLGRVSYHTAMETEYQYTYYFDNFENFKNEDTLHNIFGDQNINGMEKSDALNSADQILSLLEIRDILGEPQIYSMDAETMNRLQAEYDAKDKYGEELSEWSAAQEAYLMIYPVLYQNIPSLKMTAAGENELISSSGVYFIYGRNGWIGFDVSGIFEVKSTVRESCVCSPLEAVEEIKSSFADMILDSEIEISLVKLVYITRCDFENMKEQRIEPVWLIDGKVINSSSEAPDQKEVPSHANYIILISAVTGERIPLISIAR